MKGVGCWVLHRGAVKVHLRELEERKSFQRKPKATWGEPEAAGPVVAAPKAKGRVLSYWCFSPGIALKEFEALGVYS